MSDINADKPYLVEALHENMVDDPYGTAMYVIRRTLKESIAIIDKEEDNADFNELEDLHDLLNMIEGDSR